MFDGTVVKAGKRFDPTWPRRDGAMYWRERGTLGWQVLPLRGRGHRRLDG